MSSNDTKYSGDVLIDAVCGVLFVTLYLAADAAIVYPDYPSEYVISIVRDPVHHPILTPTEEYIDQC